MMISNTLSPETTAHTLSGADHGKYSIVMLFPCHVLTDHLAYGDGLIAYGFISEMARRGHRIYVIAHNVDVHAAFPENVEVCELSTRPEATLQDRISFLFRSRAILRRLLRERRVDLVHQLNPVCTGMSAGILGLRVPLVLGTFVAYWPPDQWPPRDPKREAKWYRPFVTSVTSIAQFLGRSVQERAASAFLITSKAALGRLTSASRRSDRVHMLRHGIDATFFRPLATSVAESPAILFFAGLAERKGVFTLLDAFEIVHATLPEVRLLFAGTGPALPEMKRRLEGMSSAHKVQLLGFVDRRDVPQLMIRGDVYCLPSYGEPYATTVIEAMACGKPVVVTDGGGLPDMIDRDGGRCVEAKNATELATALIDILRAPGLARRMGIHNRSVVENKYDWPMVVAGLEDIYAKVLQKNGLDVKRP